MDKNQSNKNNLIQRIKQINKSSNLLYYNEFLVKYHMKNIRKESNDESIICIEREINLMKKIFGDNIKEEEKEKFNKNIKEKFKKEMKIISNFSHPSLIKIIDFFEYPENIFHVISENYQCSLEEFIKMQQNKKKYFSENIILSFFAQICLGIKYIHDLNILHRNINPSNVLLISNRIVKVSNFELLRILFTSSEKSITLVNNAWSCYISPEMGLNIPYSFKNDIWSLGILLFHMMALKVPFNLTQLNIIQNTKKVDKNYLLNKIPKHFSNDIKLLCVDLLKAYPAERPDINTVLNKYRIIKNEIEHIKKTLGNIVINNNQINTNNNIKN
jgi:NIMA (never in mitosis gene a)-related kinase